MKDLVVMYTIQQELVYMSRPKSGEGVSICLRKSVHHPLGGSYTFAYSTTKEDSMFCMFWH